VLLLDLQAEEDARKKIVADARAAIEAQGELLHYDGWGERALTYPIDKKANAEYHLLQFHAGESALLDGLDRNLRITDGVMRFRIIKLAPGVGDAPAMSAAPSAVARTEPDPVEAQPEPQAASEPEAPPEAEAQPEVEAQPEPEAPVADPA